MSRIDWSDRRRPAMEQSRECAESHRQDWTQTEDDIIREYWIAHPDDRDEQAIAELLGRTTEACLNRAWKLRNGHIHGYRTPVVRRTTTTTTTTTTEYRGWKEADGDGWDD